MSKAVVKYNPDLKPQNEGGPNCDELRLLSIKQNKFSLTNIN